MTQHPRKAEFAVIGLGRFGTSLALALVEKGYHVLGIDRDPALANRHSSTITRTVVLDGTDEDALREIEIAACNAVVVAIGSDFERNVLVTVALKRLGVQQVISKALTARQREILLQLGADRVVEPEYDAGRRLAEELVASPVLGQMPLGQEGGVVALYVPHSLVGQSLAQADLRRRHGVTVLVIKREEQLLVFPGDETTLMREDLLVIVGDNDSLREFAHSF